MAEEFEVYLDRDIYNPGDIITGRVQCTFVDEQLIKAIRIFARGRAKVYWKEGRYTVFQDDRVYFNMESELLDNETTFEPGIYDYPFTFTLPENLPSSMDEEYGNVRYRVQVVIERPWSIDYERRQPFTVYSCINLNLTEGLTADLNCCEEKLPFSLFDESNPIKISVTLSRNGYVRDETIAFSARLKNESAITVEGLRFKIVQGYEFHARKRSKHHDSSVGEELAVPDSSVAPGTENAWDMEIKVPSDIFLGTLNNCEIITVFWKLRGEVCLPFPHTNFSIDVPLVIGEKC